MNLVMKDTRPCLVCKLQNLICQKEKARRICKSVLDKHRVIEIREFMIYSIMYFYCQETEYIIQAVILSDLAFTSNSTVLWILWKKISLLSSRFNYSGNLCCLSVRARASRKQRIKLISVDFVKNCFWDWVSKKRALLSCQCYNQHTLD